MTKFSLFVIALFGLVEAAENPSDIDWCKINCNDQKHHVCEYGCEISKKVPGCKKYKMTTEQKNMILNRHNELRNKIALGKDPRVPEKKLKVADMMALSYDYTLEYQSDCWAAQCDFNHDKCRNLPPGWTHVGQNLAIEQQTETTELCSDAILMKLTNAWYESEIGMLTEKVEVYDKFVGGGWGHYTQLIWANTSHIGCGVSEYRDDDFQTCYLACDYGYGGNMIDDPVFVQGEPASKCPRNTKVNSKFKGLCGEIEEATDKKNSSSRYNSSISISFMVLMTSVLLSNLY